MQFDTWQEFRPLQACFLVFRIVLRYHEPRLSALFQMNKITPELFSTSWLLTAFGFKIDELSLLYVLWYEMLTEKDQLFLIYLSIAFLQNFITEIISQQDCLIAHAISHLSISSIKDLQNIIEQARKIKKNMPYSTRIRLLQYNIFNLHTIDETICSLEQEYCLILPVQEILSRSYPNSKICDCVHVRCMWCTQKKSDFQIYVIDCRTKKEQNNGTLPNTFLLPEETYKNKQFMLDFPDQFLEVRGMAHICLMGSTGFKTSSFDIKQGTMNGEDNVVQEMIESLLQAFLIKGFPFISVVEGGFSACHDMTEYFGLELTTHNFKKCLACKKGRPSMTEIMKDKLKEMKHTFMGRDKEAFEDKKRSRSHDQDKKNAEFTIDVMLQNKKTESFKCWAFEKNKSTEHCQKFVLLFNEHTFAIGKAIKHEKFPANFDYHSKLDNLLKITSLRDRPDVLNFIFGGLAQTLTFKFKDKDVSRYIINQIKKYYAAIRGKVKK